MGHSLQHGVGHSFGKRGLHENRGLTHPTPDLLVREYPRELNGQPAGRPLERLSLRTISNNDEPGTWDITQEEVANFREYLDRGGFAIFDDFDGPRDWRVFESCMRAVYPERRFEDLQIEDPIFHCFFDIETLDMIPPYTVRGGSPEFLALRDDDGRIQVVANFNNDIGDFWEWSDESFYPVSLSNEAC